MEDDRERNKSRLNAWIGGWACLATLLLALHAYGALHFEEHVMLLDLDAAAAALAAVGGGVAGIKRFLV